MWWNCGSWPNRSCASATRSQSKPLPSVKIELSEYDRDWPRWFVREATLIKSCLGEAALRVEHVGSTSVPGLAAKPIIDIVLVVRDSADEAAYVPALGLAGFGLTVREPEWFEHRMLKGSAGDVNLHVFTIGCSEIDRMIAFRDWLRTHPSDRDIYEQAKRTLAIQTWDSVQNYADAKNEVVQEIMARAHA